MPLRINLKKIRPSYILKPRGKNIKMVYYLRSRLRECVPAAILRRRAERLLGGLDARPDRDAILDRLAYCNRLSEIRPVSGRQKVGDIPNRGSTYNIDFYEFGRYFSPELLVDTLFFDNIKIAPAPAIVKSRPIHGDVSNDVVLNLDKVRHFCFLRDRRSFASKTDDAIFRGAIMQPHRRRFMEAFFGNPLVDCGNTLTHEMPGNPPEWRKPLITLYDHLKHKFVLCIEGNDVASNLKWVMSSNSLAVMPRPKYETWFMEGRLTAGVHYVEVKDDFSDLEDKIRYYSTHISEAEEILRNAHAFVDQFRNAEREEIISLLVLRKYFEMTGQTPLWR